MPEIMLPDGSRKSFPEPVTVREVAADIGPGLAKAALAGEGGFSIGRVYTSLSGWTGERSARGVGTAQLVLKAQ